jgi:hypothetical protein
MKWITRVSMLAALAAALPMPADAIGSITSGDVTFAYTSFAQGNNDTTNADFTGAGPNDQVYESWWFFRVSGDGRETAFSAPDAEDYSLGDYATLDWTDVAGRGLFDATLNVAVIDPGVGGNLFQEMNVTALADLTIDVFHYSDFDVAGSAGSDSASLISAGPDVEIGISDGGGTIVPFVGYGANGFKVTDWSNGGGSRSLLRDLTDNNTDDLDDSGLPFAAGDFTGGFQWTLNLVAGETATLLTQFGTDAPLLPPSAMPAPEPGSAILMGLGLLGLGIQGRRTRRVRPRPPARD